MRFAFGITAWLALSGFGGVIPSEAIAIPSAASASGFTTLAMNQDASTGFDFDATGTADGHMWHAGFWQNVTTNTNSANQIFRDTDGSIKIEWLLSQIAQNAATISTATNNLSSYRAFGHGYYEWIWKFSPNNTVAWAATWLNGAQTGLNCLARGYPTIPISPSTVYSEIDTPENSFTNDQDAHESYNYSATSTNCGTVAPTFYTVNAGARDVTQYHSYAVLWTSANITYYIDGIQVGQTTPQTGTAGELHTVQSWLAEQCNGSYQTIGSCSVPSEMDMNIQSIRYWSCASWQSNALAC